MVSGSGPTTFSHHKATPPPLTLTYQAVGTGVGGHTDAGGKGTTLPGGQSLPKFFCQEGHQWGEEAQTNIGAGEQDLRGSWGTWSLRQHWLYRFLGRELTGRTATPRFACLSLLCRWGPAPGLGYMLRS